MPQLFFRDELRDKHIPSSKVSVLVFKDGDVINFVRVIENDDGSYQLYGTEKSSTAPKTCCTPDQPERDSMQEYKVMAGKLKELRGKMLKRRQRKMTRDAPIDCASTSQEDDAEYR